MKKQFRLVLYIATLAIGGWLGTIFLADFGLLKMLVFLAICSVLGEVFHQIDKKVFKK